MNASGTHERGRIADLLLAGIFLTAIIAPALGTVLFDTAEVSRTENRRFAGLPDWGQAQGAPRDYTDAFEAWFNDHFGFRQQLVTVHNLLHARALGHSPVKGIVVGERDWLYYDAQFALDDHQGHLQVPGDVLDRWKRTLQSRSDWLAARGVRYLFIVVPNKMTVYPQHLPGRYRRQSGPSVLEQFTGFLAADPVPAYLDLSATLRAAMPTRQTYFRTDSHWNRWGAYIGYREIGARLKHWFPGFRRVEQDDLRTYTDHKIGGLAKMLSLSDHYPEPTISTRVRRPCAARKPRRIPHTGYSGRWSARENGCPSAHPTAVMIHDSFGTYLQPFLSEGFAKIVYINYAGFDESRELIIKIRPDVVIELWVQRSLPLAVAPDARIETDAPAADTPSPSLIPR